MDRDLGGVGAMVDHGMPTLSATIAPEDLRITAPPSQTVSHTMYSVDTTTDSYNGQRQAQPSNALQALADVAEHHHDLDNQRSKDLPHRGSLFVPLNNPDSRLRIVENKLASTYNVIKTALPSVRDPRARARLESVLEDPMHPVSKQGSSTQPSGSSDEDGTRQGVFPCTWGDCGKWFDLRCKLTKHEKRHNRVYLCTNARCNYAGGSKSDWKRHEDGCGRGKIGAFHSSDEGLRICLWDDPTTKSGKCGFSHGEKGRFKAHLRDVHLKENVSQLDTLTQEWQIPSPNEGFGWCGFCVDIVQWSLKQNLVDPCLRKAARYEHIDRHIQEGRVMLTEYIKHEPGPQVQQWFVALKGKEKASKEAPKWGDHMGRETRNIDKGAFHGPIIAKRKGSPLEKGKGEENKKKQKNNWMSQWTCVSI